MAEERQILLEIEVDRKGAEKQLEENAEQLEKNKEELKELNKSYKDGETDVKTYAKEKLRLQNTNKELNKENRNLIKTLDAEDNSLNSLRLQLSRLTQERNNTNQGTKEGAQRFEELQREILKTTEAIKGQEEAAGDFRRNVGNYTESIEEAALNTNVFGTSVGGIKEQFLALANPVTAAIGLVGALGAAYLKTGRGSKDLERATDRLETSFDLLGESVADLLGTTGEKGFLDTLVRQFIEFTQGPLAAIESDIINLNKELIRDAQILQLENDKLAKQRLKEAEELRQIRDEERNSIEVRNKANQDLTKVIDERLRIQEESLNKQLAAFERLNKRFPENRKFLQEIAQLELEIADVQEEAAGFRSEQLANDLALAREVSEDQLALLESRIAEELILVEEGSREELELRERLLNERLKIELQAVGDNVNRQNTVIQNALNERLQLYKDYQDNIVQLERITNEERVDLEQATSRKIEKVDTNLVEQKIKNIEREIEAERLKNEITLNATAQLFGSVSTLFEQNTAAYKATASIEAAISTYLAINKTLASLPFPANAISAAAIGVQGFANVAKINGLFSGGGGGATPSVGGATSVPRIESRTTLSGAFDRNQLTNGANQQQAQTDQITSTFRNLPQPVVKVTDINKTQKRTSQVKVNSGL